MNKSMLGVIVAALAGLALFSGCTSGPKDPGGEAKNEAPRITTINLTPASARAGDQLTAVVSASDPEGDLYRIEYQWYLNDELEEGADGEVFDTSGLAGGDRILFKARASASAGGVESDWKVSNVVKLETAYGPALKGVSLEPENVFARDSVRAVVDYGETDPDSVDRIYYRWYVNKDVAGDEDEEIGDELTPDHFQRNDYIRVDVCTDGLFQAPNLWTNAFPKVISNSPPYFTSGPDITQEGMVLTIYAEAADDDNDRFTFTLRDQPPGAQVQGIQGGFIINLEKVPPGTHSIIFVVDDGHGDQAVYSHGFTIPEPG